ncbi:MAG: CopG family transcriptional regulator [Proteobacteria bacterium]|nr:CopG family transcriptional regulator [Pseudomonadota bacterium]
MKRIGYVGIIVEDKKKSEDVNKILSAYGTIIVGRMGIPYGDIGIITLIVNGTTDEIGAFTGKLGMIKGVSVKKC